MVAGSFVLWNTDEHLEGVPEDLRNSVKGILESRRLERAERKAEWQDYGRDPRPVDAQGKSHPDHDSFNVEPHLRRIWTQQDMEEGEEAERLRQQRIALRRMADRERTDLQCRVSNAKRADHHRHIVSQRMAPSGSSGDAGAVSAVALVVGGLHVSGDDLVELYEKDFAAVPVEGPTGTGGGRT